jgi:hypothetical protein
MGCVRMCVCMCICMCSVQSNAPGVSALAEGVRALLDSSDDSPGPAPPTTDGAEPSSDVRGASPPPPPPAAAAAAAAALGGRIPKLCSEASSGPAPPANGPATLGSTRIDIARRIGPTAMSAGTTKPVPVGGPGLGERDDCMRWSTASAPTAALADGCSGGGSSVGAGDTPVCVVVRRESSGESAEGEWLMDCGARERTGGARKGHQPSVSSEASWGAGADGR